MNVKDMPEISLNFDAELRKWCLERAFETRELSGVSHMEVTNVADDYYQWIVKGRSQGNSLGSLNPPDHPSNRPPSDHEGSSGERR